MTTAVDKFVIAIVGGGPRSVYALERLLALLKNSTLRRQFEIHIFEPNGRYGAGVAHSDCQTRSSYLNRTADQIAFAADESVTVATHLLPTPLRMTFLEWCQLRWRQSGDSIFNVQAQDVPRRYLHGMALRDFFELYAAQLRQIDGVNVSTHPEQVIGVSCSEQGFCLITPQRPAGLAAHHILFITGHTPCRPAEKSTEARFARNFNYIPWAYPLEERFTELQIPAHNSIALLGMGLTALDICLFLTEARGGTFIRQRSGRLHYQPSGKEPHAITALSRSGKVYATRPRNEKLNPNQFHTGIFFTISAVSLLRQHCGRTNVTQQGVRQSQLDFELDLFPLIVLEMAWVYYRTLLGEQWLSHQLTAVNTAYHTFLSAQVHSGVQDIERLLAPMQQGFDDLVERLSTTHGGTVNTMPEDADVACHIYRTLTDEIVDTAQAPSRLQSLGPEKVKWQHSPRLIAHKFDWHAIFYPFSKCSPHSTRQRKKQILTWLSKDLDAARQGNIRNPLKACCDNVWRDLRTVFSSACDFGGLTPTSQKNFIQQWLPHYNRLSNGASIEVMEKMEALVRQGIVLLPAAAKISSKTLGNTFVLHYGGKKQRVNHLVCARVHPFDARYQVNPLYPDMLAKGIIQLWVNRRSPTDFFIPGAVDITPDFHPVMYDGTVDDRLTFLGSPAEGACFFQNTAARPAANSNVLSDVHHWAAALVTKLLSRQQEVQPDAIGEVGE
ncbi:FAD/NAD(P)-binding protein [Pectobacterium punjabense]|uniref:FAD/NAD(P)-binding protein n=1 Tax=Pectobacterium punjabense TaxID=2108399 RepID=UPI0038261E90